MESRSHEAQSGFAQPPPGAGRIAILDPLRGLAAFAVMWYHFVWTASILHGAQGPAFLLRATGEHGWLGVEVFFVISGFVLPYAMWRGRYRLRDYGRFLAKRLLRLEPPYLVALAVSMGLWLASSATPWFAGEPFVFEWPRFLLHFAYLNAFFDYPWYNDVFWTLAIEFQYYLLIALLFPLFVDKRLVARLALPLGMALIALAPFSSSLVFHYLALFALGIATAQYYVGMISRRIFVVLYLVLSVLAFVTLTPLQAFVGVGAAGFIAVFARAEANSVIGRIFSWKPLVGLGVISYSLYLIHFPIGMRVVNIGARLVDGLFGQIVVLILAVGVSVGVSYVMYKLIELPSQRWSSRVSYRKSAKQSSIRLPKSRAVLEGSPA